MGYTTGIVEPQLLPQNTLLPAAGPPLVPLQPLNINGLGGYPLRNDNATCLAYVGTGTGLTLPEMYIAYRPSTPTSALAIAAGSTAILKNMQTGLWCHLVPVPAAYPLYTTNIRSRHVAANALPKSCATSGMICDQATAATATVFTYTGGRQAVGAVGDGCMCMSPVADRRGRCKHSAACPPQLHELPLALLGGWRA